MNTELTPRMLAMGLALPGLAGCNDYLVKNDAPAAAADTKKEMKMSGEEMHKKVAMLVRMAPARGFCTLGNIDIQEIRDEPEIPDDACTTDPGRG